MTISPGPVTSPSMRDAVLTTSPSTVNSRRRGDPMSPVMPMPVLIAMRICSCGPDVRSFKSASDLRMTMAAVTALIA